MSRIWTASRAVAVMRAAGYEPQEPYPGTTVQPWKCRCSACGEIRTPRLANVRRGSVCICARQWSPARILEAAQAAGYEPLEPYPGTVSELWRCRCTTCGEERGVRMYRVLRGARCGACREQRARYSQDEATAILEQAGWSPSEPYPGLAHRPWAVTCASCGRRAFVPPTEVRNRGRRCRACHPR